MPEKKGGRQVFLVNCDQISADEKWRTCTALITTEESFAHQCHDFARNRKRSLEINSSTREQVRSGRHFILPGLATDNTGAWNINIKNRYWSGVFCVAYYWVFTQQMDTSVCVCFVRFGLRRELWQKRDRKGGQKESRFQGTAGMVDLEGANFKLIDL